MQQGQADIKATSSEQMLDFNTTQAKVPNKSFIIHYHSPEKASN
jgi:hypothetical protein